MNVRGLPEKYALLWIGIRADCQLSASWSRALSPHPSAQRLYG
jgi:hypothetical protein